MAKHKVTEPGKKVKTSITIDKALWTKWIQFVVSRTGSARKLSEELEKAIQEHLIRHKRP